MRTNIKGTGNTLTSKTKWCLRYQMHSGMCPKGNRAPLQEAFLGGRTCKLHAPCTAKVSQLPEVQNEAPGSGTQFLCWPCGSALLCGIMLYFLHPVERKLKGKMVTRVGASTGTKAFMFTVQNLVARPHLMPWKAGYGSLAMSSQRENSRQAGGQR